MNTIKLKPNNFYTYYKNNTTFTVRFTWLEKNYYAFENMSRFSLQNWPYILLTKPEIEKFIYENTAEKLFIIK